MVNPRIGILAKRDLFRSICIAVHLQPLKFTFLDARKGMVSPYLQNTAMC
jgi:hypothetical protein